MRAVWAEWLGTFTLVFMGTGAAIVEELHPGTVTHVGISLVFGLVVLALVYTLGHVSGAHINPAVTLVLCIAKRMSWRQFVPFVVAQMVGAICASGLLRWLFADSVGLGGTAPSGDVWQSFVLEIVLTWFLLQAVLGCSTGTKEAGWLVGVVAGSVVALEALFAGPICGASMNPARSLGPAVWAGGEWMQTYWIYAVAPSLGAVLAVVTNGLLTDPLKRDESVSHA